MEFKPFDLYSDYRLSLFAATTATGMSALADKTMLSTATSWSGLRRPQQCAHLRSGAINWPDDRLRRASRYVCAHSVATVSDRSRSSSQTAPQPGPSGGAMWPFSISGALSRPHSSPSARRRRGSAAPRSS